MKEASRRKPLVEASPVTSPGSNLSPITSKEPQRDSQGPEVHDTNQNPTGEEKGFKDPLTDSSSS